MKTDIILAGVGGQGILTIAACIGMAALNSDMHIKQSEVHGMSQRGGAVESHLRISDSPISSDLISYGTADLIISVEPMEGLRYLPYLSKDGWLVTNSAPFLNIKNYPNLDKVLNSINEIEQHIVINANDLAKEIKASHSSNIIMLGAASPFIAVAIEKLELAIKTIFEKKGDEIINQNIKALHVGREEAIKQTKK
jgi:indolepyruvate ferredoxin oxidoreductase beta subunit